MRLAYCFCFYITAAVVCKAKKDNLWGLAWVGVCAGGAWTRVVGIGAWIGETAATTPSAA